MSEEKFGGVFHGVSPLSKYLIQPHFRRLDSLAEVESTGEDGEMRGPRPISPLIADLIDELEQLVISSRQCLVVLLELTNLAFERLLVRYDG